MVTDPHGAELPPKIQTNENLIRQERFSTGQIECRGNDRISATAIYRSATFSWSTWTGTLRLADAEIRNPLNRIGAPNLFR